MSSGTEDRPRLPRAHALARPRLGGRGDAPCRVRRARPAFRVARARAPDPQPDRGQRTRRAARPDAPAGRRARRAPALPHAGLPRARGRAVRGGPRRRGLLLAGRAVPLRDRGARRRRVPDGGRRGARRRARQRLRARPAARPPRARRPRDGRVHLRQHRARRAACAGRARRRARRDRRLGRPSRQRHPGGVLGRSVRVHDLAPPGRLLPARLGRGRRARRRRRARGERQPPAASRLGRRRLRGRLRARRAARARALRARPGADRLRLRLVRLGLARAPDAAQRRLPASDRGAHRRRRPARGRAPGRDPRGRLHAGLRAVLRPRRARGARGQSGPPADDPFLPIFEGYGYQELQPQQEAVIAEAERLLEELS